MVIRKPWYVYRDEAGENGEQGGGAGTQGAAEGAGDTAKPAGEDGPKDMLAALDAGLGYKPGADGGGTGTVKPTQTPEEKAAADAKASNEAAKKDIETRAAAGDPDAIKAKADAEAAEKAKAAQPKDLKTLELTEADKRVMKGKTAERYNEVLTIAKTERARAETAEAQYKTVAASRNAILEVMKETNTTQEDLGNLLELNRLIKSGQPADLERALTVITNQRMALLKVLGREGDGFDPLAEHPDLMQEVEDQKITRERALELAGVRKRDALAQSQEQARQRTQQSAQQSQEAQQKAMTQGLTDIETWSAGLAKSDIDFKAKEAILLPRITEIVQSYPPNLWLQTIKTVYASITVQKAAPSLPGPGNGPLRASGAKPGGPAPTSMAEAIDQGLGYKAA